LASHSEIGDFGNRHGTLEPRHYCLSQVFCEAMPDSRLTRLDKLRWPSSQFDDEKSVRTQEKASEPRKFRRLLAGRSSQAAEQAAVQPLGSAGQGSAVPLDPLGSAGQGTLSVRGSRGRWPDSPHVTGMCEHLRNPVYFEISANPRQQNENITDYIHPLHLRPPVGVAVQSGGAVHFRSSMA
jgi:hypothetical protein